MSNWNQDRQDHARAQSYYRRIASDLMANRAKYDNTMKFWRKVQDYGRVAIANGESGQRVDGSNWKTVLAWYQASQLMPFEFESITFSEMRDDGSFALVSDKSLRKQLAVYYRFSGNGITADILHHNPEYRMQIRGLTPWRVQQYIWSNCFRQTGGGSVNQELIDCPSPMSEVEAASVFDTYQHSATLLQNLRTGMSTLNISALILTGTRDDLDRLAGKVQAAQAQHDSSAQNTRRH